MIAYVFVYIFFFLQKKDLIIAAEHFRNNEGGSKQRELLAKKEIKFGLNKAPICMFLSGCRSASRIRLQSDIRCLNLSQASMHTDRHKDSQSHGILSVIPILLFMDVCLDLLDGQCICT